MSFVVPLTVPLTVPLAVSHPRRRLVGCAAGDWRVCGGGRSPMGGVRVSCWRAGAVVCGDGAAAGRSLAVAGGLLGLGAAWGLNGRREHGAAGGGTAAAGDQTRTRTAADGCAPAGGFGGACGGLEARKTEGDRRATEHKRRRNTRTPQATTAASRGAAGRREHGTAGRTTTTARHQTRTRTAAVPEPASGKPATPARAPAAVQPRFCVKKK